MEIFNLNDLNLNYNEKKLISVVVQDDKTSNILMMAWMNLESLKKTLKNRNMVYWSRSRNELWTKGETSGNTQRLVRMYVDCDRDCLLANVNQIGPACHTNNPSCFYTEIN